VLDIIAEHVEHGAIAVKGNHDAAVSGSVDGLNHSAARAIEWTRAQLGAVHREFLDSLPLCVHEGPACFVHASADTPERWDYVESPAAAERSMRAAGATYTFSGHVHDQVLYMQAPGQRVLGHAATPGMPMAMRDQRRWLALVGSVGQPRDANPASAYSLMDLDAQSITFHRVPYDNRSAARKIRAAKLPEGLAFRLERGI
jgi:diadenosine tetraphosphatase ApaH/serine/threonine PP2A family protein phosphatase